MTKLNIKRLLINITKIILFFQLGFGCNKGNTISEDITSTQTNEGDATPSKKIKNEDNQEIVKLTKELEQKIKEKKNKLNTINLTKIPKTKKELKKALNEIKNIEKTTKKIKKKKNINKGNEKEKYNKKNNKIKKKNISNPQVQKKEKKDTDENNTVSKKNTKDKIAKTLNNSKKKQTEKVNTKLNVTGSKNDNDNNKFKTPLKKEKKEKNISKPQMQKKEKKDTDENNTVSKKNTKDKIAKTLNNSKKKQTEKVNTKLNVTGSKNDNNNNKFKTPLKKQKNDKDKNLAEIVENSYLNMCTIYWANFEISDKTKTIKTNIKNYLKSRGLSSITFNGEITKENNIRLTNFNVTFIKDLLKKDFGDKDENVLQNIFAAIIEIMEDVYKIKSQKLNNKIFNPKNEKNHTFNQFIADYLNMTNPSDFKNISHYLGEDIIKNKKNPEKLQQLTKLAIFLNSKGLDLNKKINNQQNSTINTNTLNSINSSSFKEMLEQQKDLTVSYDKSEKLQGISYNQKNKKN